MKVKDSELEKYSKRRKLSRFVSLGIVVLLVLSVLIGAVSFYGDRVGEYVISVEKETETGLALSETIDFATPRTTLVAQGVSKQTDTTRLALPNDLMEHPGGSHNDPMYRSYFAYTFYVKNASKNLATIAYEVSVNIKQATREIDECMRMIVYRGGEEEKIYAKPKKGTEDEVDETFDNNGVLQYNNQVNFESASVVCRYRREAFMANAIDKYTLVMWLEGWDPECTDYIRGGRLTLDMDFVIV